jgi:polyisoprenoid-binding protein YceI
VHLDPPSRGESIEVDLEVDLSRLDTGIELRNKHMRENHLHTDRWPKATFRGGRVSERSHDALTAGRRTTFTLAGTLELHGEARRVSVPVAITPQPDGGLRVESSFQVKLSDHGIPRPQFLVMKLDDVQRIDLDLVLSRHAGK